MVICNQKLVEKNILEYGIMFFLSRIENNLQAGTLSVNIYETGYYLTSIYFFIAQNNYLTEKTLYMYNNDKYFPSNKKG